MATVNVTHVVKDPTGTALQGIKVSAKLSVPAFRGDGSQISQVVEATTDAGGAVTLVLEKNADTSKPTSFYIVDINLSGFAAGPKRYKIQATASQTLQASIIP